ncbi:unnamed protein product [Caenorhabditis auriculariae]|uniref:Signal recognition particle receptor subunit beta n=1 Tax=Caenorhabditis auriculariae TaxID=2777116 RepID=A0A8S1HT20_9PELO|nr:unnamed protein product [Caenorhabditis auriculariae]
MDLSDPTTIGIIIAGVVGILTVLLLVFKLFVSDSRDTVLIVGLSDSGKTYVFSKIANKGANPTTYTSMQEKCSTIEC